MQVQPAKSELIQALKQRARPFESHVSNPASGAAYEQLQDQIKLLQTTPGETVGEVQASLRAQAKELEQGRNKRALIALGMFTGLGVSLAVCGGPSYNAWIQGFNVVATLAGAGALMQGFQYEEARQSWVTAADSLNDLAPAAPASDVGNLRGAPTVSLSGPATVAQLTDLLQATRESLESHPQPEFDAARKQLGQDLKNLARFPGPSLEEARGQADSRDRLGMKLLRASPWGLGAGVLAIFLADRLAPGLLYVGAGCILGTFAATVTGNFMRMNADDTKKTLGNWEPQLQALKAIDQAGQEMREWGKEKGPGIEQTASSVIVGGIRIPVKRKNQA